MALIDINSIAEHPEFRRRVKGALVKMSVLIVGEAVAIDKVTLGSKRHALGVDVLNNPDSKINAFSYATAANPSITSSGVSAPDGDIEYTVITVFNDIAGVLNSEI